MGQISKGREQQRDTAELVGREKQVAAKIEVSPARLVGWRGTSLLNTDQAAMYLNLAKATLESMRVRGGGPLFIRLGRAVRYRPEDLDAWIGARVHATTAAPGR